VLGIHTDEEMLNDVIADDIAVLYPDHSPHPLPLLLPLTLTLPLTTNPNHSPEALPLPLPLTTHPHH
jgi:hypothetical protein